MGYTYADPDVNEDTKERIRTELSEEGPREPWDLVHDLVDTGVPEESVRKALRSLTFGGELTTTSEGEVELRDSEQ